MLLKDLLEGMEYRLLSGSLETEIGDIVYDSRKVKRNTAFVCMRGTKTDSHDYIPQALEQGASALIVEQTVEGCQEACPWESADEGVAVVQVPNGREALARLSAAYFGHPTRKLTAIGVTGTKGKTTVTYMIKSILESAGKKVGLVGTNGIVIGKVKEPTMNTTPESYLLQEAFHRMVEAGCEYMVMEVSSQGLKMHRVDGIDFDYGIFTNISPDHIGPDEHADFEEYLACKAMLFDRCKVGLFNADDEHTESIMKMASCKCYTFGMEQPADFYVDDVEYVADTDFVGVAFEVKGRYSVDARVNIPGRFNVSNALAAISLCSFLGLSKEKLCHALEHIVVDGRMEIVHASPRCTVIVDYAHNAVSMESLLTTLRDYHPKRLVCVFGCGGNRSKLRRYDMGEIAGRMADFSIITADNSRYEKVEDIIADIQIGLHKNPNPSYIVIPDRREAIFHSILEACPGDMVVIIGKGHEDYQEVNGVRHYFLDKAVALEALRAVKEEGGSAE